jgi:hypothetical protein
MRRAERTKETRLMPFSILIDVVENCLKLVGPFLGQQMASRRMASNGCRTRDEHRQYDSEHQQKQQRSDQDQPGLRVTKIQSPSETVALFDKQRGVIGIVVKEPSIPVAIIIAENDAGALTICGCARFCTGTLRMPKQNEDKDNYESPDKQENEPSHAH